MLSSFGLLKLMSRGSTPDTDSRCSRFAIKNLLRQFFYYESLIIGELAQEYTILRVIYRRQQGLYPNPNFLCYHWAGWQSGVHPGLPKSEFGELRMWVEKIFSHNIFQNFPLRGCNNSLNSTNDASTVLVYRGSITGTSFFFFPPPSPVFMWVKSELRNLQCKLRGGDVSQCKPKGAPLVTVWQVGVGEFFRKLYFLSNFEVRTSEVVWE